MNQTDMAENTGEGSAAEPQKSFIIRAREEAKAITGNKEINKLFKDLVKEVMKQAPVVGGMVTAADKIYHGLVEMENAERQQRLKDYAIGILENYQEDVEFRTEDVLPVIRKLAADDEAAKTEYYTRLTLALGRTPLSVMPETLRYHFVLLVSRLTHFQIEFARELNIRQTVPVCGTVSCEAAELALTGQDRGIVIQAVRALQNEGLMKEKTYLPREKKPEGTLYKTTADFDTLMKLLFHRGDFAPETVGLQRKAVSDIILVGSPRFIDNLYTTYLPEELKKAGLTVKIVERNDDHLTTDWAPLYLHTVTEDSRYDEKITLHLTQEALRPMSGKGGESYVNCSCEKRTYLREKSSNQKEVESFKENIDRVVRCSLAKINEIKSPA